MDTRTLYARGLLLGLLCVAALAAWLPSFAAGSFAARGGGDHLTVHFLDVGQGDAILIETPDGVQVLIDGGRDSSVLRQLGKHLRLTDRSLDVVIATHPDSDHIGGLVDVLARYDVERIILTDNRGDSPTADAFLEVVSAEGATVTYARAGQQLSLGASTTLAILFPASDSVAELESNTSSIVAQLRYGDVEFMLTGDAPASIEQFLVERYGNALASEVLKVGHHGSRTSTAETFVATVEPEFSVISAGCDNRYGHPHEEVLEALAGTEVLGTCEEGTISFVSDGREVWTE